MAHAKLLRREQRFQDCFYTHAALRQEADPAPRRELIPVEVRKAVFDRDGGRRRNCGSNFEIQYDHIIPFSMGGASTVENLQILCAPCNREKGASL
jgi:5-methylcytosine-specific restriction endonuclease McrA